jgi:hypothetical protein
MEYKETMVLDDYNDDDEEAEEREEKEEKEQEEKYDFKTNIECGLPETVYTRDDPTFQWIPPEKSGLDYCNYIIPPYYNIHKNYNKSFSLDYVSIIKDDIKNYRKLNPFQLEYMKGLDNKYKDELLDTYYICMNSIIDNVIMEEEECNKKNDFTTVYLEQQTYHHVPRLYETISSCVRNEIYLG